MSDESPKQSIDWDEWRRRAEIRPVMFIGGPENAHLEPIRAVIRLVWQAKVFYRADSISIDLSPNQYIVRAICGPLIRPIEKILSFGTSQTLWEPWRDDIGIYMRKIIDEDEERGISFGRQRNRRGWRYCFSGPLGPRLEELSYPAILTHSVVWGIRSSKDLWCESYRNGRPYARPFMLDEPSHIGCFAAGYLDPQWFTGLPYDADDVALFANYAERRPEMTDRKWLSRPAWTPGAIKVN